MESRGLSLEYDVVAEGVVSAALNGTLNIRGENDITLSASGLFVGKDVEIFLDADGAAMRGGLQQKPFTMEMPFAVREGLFIGLTRMGIPHNLARLSASSPPDGIKGDAREWVKVGDIETRTPETGSLVAIGFDIFVSGQPAVTATLWLDENTGLPVRREQTVHFQNGDMQVEETYSRFRIGKSDQ